MGLRPIRCSVEISIMSTSGHVHVLRVSSDATFRDVNASGLRVAVRCGVSASPTPRPLPTRITDNLYTTDSVSGGPGRQQGLDRHMHLLPPRMSEYTEATLRITFTMPKTFTAMRMAASILAYHTQHLAGFVQWAQRHACSM
jgi:hypothetical protein